jgi:hypothetical protein
VSRPRPRPEVIEELLQGALEGMTVVAKATPGVTNDEIISAYFSLMRRGVQAAMQLSTSPPATREALRQSFFNILLDLAEPRGH